MLLPLRPDVARAVRPRCSEWLGTDTQDGLVQSRGMFYFRLGMIWSKPSGWFDLDAQGGLVRLGMTRLRLEMVRLRLSEMVWSRLVRLKLAESSLFRMRDVNKLQKLNE